MTRRQAEVGFHDEKSSAIRERFKGALAQEWIWPSFQPIIELRSRALAGFEILARWDDPLWGQVGPDVFTPV